MSKIFGKSFNGPILEFNFDLDKGGDGGSEGRVYFSFDGQLCLKKFHKEAISKSKSTKIEAMLNPKFDDIKNMSIMGSTISWPTFSAHEKKRGKAVGYIMKNVKNTESLNKIFAPTDELYKKAKFSDRIFIAGLLSVMFATLHKNGVIIGDANPANIRISAPTSSNTWCVHIIDTDSFQISNNGEELTSDVGHEEYSSRSLLARQKSSKTGNIGWEGLTRIPDDDNFALAILIFQILFSFHPMRARKSKIRDNIEGGRFAYGGNRSLLPKAAPIEAYNQLPARIRTMFRTAFTGGSIPSARDWALAMNELEGVSIVVKPVVHSPQPVSKPTTPTSRVAGGARRAASAPVSKVEDLSVAYRVGKFISSIPRFVKFAVIVGVGLLILNIFD